MADLRDKLRDQLLRVNLPEVLRPFYESAAAKAFYRDHAPAVLEEVKGILALPDSEISPAQTVRLVECLHPTKGLQSSFYDEGSHKSMLELAHLQLRLSRLARN